MPGPDYDILVIGGGHAGAEAAWAAANVLRDEFDETAGRRGRVGLVTMDPDKIGQMSCNPAIGGLAKGQMVREIDALGGLMGLAIDATGIQFRMLNASKGPAVRGPRAQADKYAYAREVQRLLRNRPNLDIITGTVEGFILEHGRCTGIQLGPSPPGASHFSATHQPLHAHAIVLTTGTFMRGLMHTGDRRTPGGRVGEAPANTLSAELQRLGFDLGRLKTGTPPRLDARTIDFDALQVQPGDETPQPFSDMTDAGGNTTRRDDPAYARVADRFPVLTQTTCWITHTNAAIHDLIRDNLDRAPMHNGTFDAECGPRYCPSIEDKVVRFAEKSAHHVFLEPESLDTHEIYCNGISTSLPGDVQDRIVAQLPGCEKATILRHGYAVEYDMVWPHQIDATTMSKPVPGLFLAGQINGTSGYEEAAGQGLLAGLNAVRHARGEDLVRFGRDEAYIGVLMDDLVTKTPREPYRMFTSRAEHRLMLRADNAGDRLTEYGRSLGLVDDARWSVHQQRVEAKSTLEKTLKQLKQDDHRLWDTLRRPEVTPEQIAARLERDAPATGRWHDRRGLNIIAAAITEQRYAGFIERHRREHDRLGQMEHRRLPTDLDYDRITGLRNEAKQTLSKFRPATLGQAGRLAGITPADLTVLALTLDRRPADVPALA